jgi:hypothetical protein
VLQANYGVSERLDDVGVALPFQRIDLNVRIVATVENIATSTAPGVIHQFDDGTTQHTYPESGSASGIGDMLLREVNSIRTTASAALGSDVRLTGDETELLGAGATQVYGVAAASGRRRGRAGYTFERRQRVHRRPAGRVQLHRGLRLGAPASRSPRTSAGRCSTRTSWCSRRRLPVHAAARHHGPPGHRTTLGSEKATRPYPVPWASRSTHSVGCCLSAMPIAMRRRPAGSGHGV